MLAADAARHEPGHDLNGVSVAHAQVLVLQHLARKSRLLRVKAAGDAEREHHPQKLAHVETASRSFIIV